MNYKVIIFQLYEKVVEIKKEYFVSGMPPEIYEIIMSIQAAFFLSHKIRKYVELFLIFQKENLVIHYVGQKLRYLGPDERSIGMLLMKALAKKEQLQLNQKIRSTPGIWVQKNNFFELLLKFKKNWEIIVADKHSKAEIKAFTEKNVILIILGLDSSGLQERIFGLQPPNTRMGTKDLVDNMRNYHTILSFYSCFDKIRGKNEEII